MTLKRGLLMLIVAAMLADLWTFYSMQNVVWVEAQEQNPVMLWMYVNVGGLFGVALLKVVRTAVISSSSRGLSAAGCWSPPPALPSSSGCSAPPATSACGSAEAASRLWP